MNPTQEAIAPLTGVVAASDGKKTTPIDAALQSQTETLSYLLELVTQLEKRLSPLCNGTLDAGNPDPLAQPGNSPLAVSIGTATQVIQALNNRLSALLNVLEV